MLEFMRRRARSTWIKAIFLIIVVVFVFWGIGGSIGGSRTDVVANVNGREITVREFQRAYENIKSAYRELYKERFTSDLVEALNLRQQTLDQLIDSRLLEQEALRVGFMVDDEEVRQAIKEIPAFQ